jgi:hypothetical protein
VEELGAGSGSECVQTLAETALEFVGAHESQTTPRTVGVLTRSHTPLTLPGCVFAGNHLAVI